MIVPSSSDFCMLSSYQLINKFCDLHDGVWNASMPEPSPATVPIWRQGACLWGLVPLCLLYLSTHQTKYLRSRPTLIIRKISTILIVALSIFHLWKVRNISENFVVSNEDLWTSVGILDLIMILVPFGILLRALGQLLLPDSGDRSSKPSKEHAEGCKQEPLKPVPESVHPEDEASFLSKLFLLWVFRVVWSGYKKKLSEEDVPTVNSRDKCDMICPLFEHAWKQEELQCQLYNTHKRLNNGIKQDSVNGSSDDHTDSAKQNSGQENEEIMKLKASLLRALIRAYGVKYFIIQFLNCALKLSDFIYPLVIESLMKYIQNRDTEPLWKGYALVFGSCLAAILSDTMHPRLWVCLRRLTFQIKMAITVAVYKKALTLSNGSRKETTAGQLVSLISEDLDKVTHAMEEIYYVFLTPIQVMFAVFLLYRQLGWISLVALAFLLSLIPVNHWLGKKLEDLDKQKDDIKDDRVKVMNEILNGIKVLKLYAWEKSFFNKVNRIRDEEIAIGKKIGLCYAGIDGIFKAMLFLVRFIGLVSVVLIGDQLDSPKAFLIMTLFLLLSYPFSEVAMVIPACVQARVSLLRINDFLTDKDIAEDVVTVDSSSDFAISIKDGTFTWNPAHKATLRNINLEVPKGSLVAVVGMVGSGKSSLLSAMLGEMEKLEGNVTVQSSLAYVSQEAWIQNATVRDNILFGSEFEHDKYSQVIRACALQDDLKIFAAGDTTEIGEKGINLSGGQKQRVSLARAVYSDADIYILDDPLSAVDAHVGKHIFNQVIGHSGMLKDKTRVLVTHGVHWLPFVDNIIVMKGGAISEFGTYKELLTHNGAFAQFLKETLSHKQEDDDVEVEQIKRTIYSRLASLDEGKSPADYFLEDEKCGCTIDKETEAGKDDSSDSKSCDDYDEDTDEEDEARGKIIDEEGTESGSVSWKVYKEYIMTLSPRWIVILCLTYAVLLSTRDFGMVWVGRWTEDPLLANMSMVNTTEYRSTLWMYVSIFAIIGVVEIVANFLCTIGINRRSLTAATQLHTRLFTNILRCPMAFFDTTPTGRIINRFSKDIDSVDRLGEGVDGYMECAGDVLINLIMIVTMCPNMIPFIFVVTGVYIFLQKMYVPAARQLRRYRSKYSSPVFVHFKETLDGTHTLRAFKAQDRFVAKMKKTLEDRMKFDIMFNWVRHWFGIKMSTLAQLVSLAAGLLVMSDESMSPSHAGLILSFSSWFVESLEWYISHASYTEQELVSLERVMEYSNKPTEAAWEQPEMLPASDWPHKGDVVFNDYKARYRDGLDLVLKGVTCTIKDGEKIGIVGRTGAGKSSLTIALFRLVEAAEGHIRIDDHQISNLGLHDLRKRITILPQDPVIFGGSLRMNLDPFNEKSSEELWEALKHSHLQTFVESLPGKLDYECGEAGKNLSVGQRQLVCLARTLLRKTKVLVLDEATAAVDMETDDLIQKTLCSEFKNCTVLTIAHRLNTVMDYDRILVMDQGLVKEFDSPKNLLANPESVFYGMAKDANLI